MPLVVQCHSADIMATLLILKQEVEQRRHSKMILTFTGASEAHLLAKELGSAGVGIIVAPSRPFPAAWESRRMSDYLFLCWSRTD
jgi:hypothetical protein